MPLLLLAALPLILIPLLELYLLVKVGGWIGVLPTLLLCLGTAVAGVYLVRLQGFAVLRRLSGALGEGAPLASDLLEGALLLLAGLLLLLPGFLSDLLGLLLLIPPLRGLLIRGLRRRFPVQEVQVRGEPASPGAHRIIEGEYQRERD